MGRPKKEELEKKAELIEKEIKQKREIFGIFLIALVFLIFFSLIGKAGFLGTYLNKILLFLGGKAVYFIPFLLLPFIYYLIRGKGVNLNNILGAIFIFLSFSALFSLLAITEDISFFLEGGGGGIIGYGLGFIFYKLFSFLLGFLLLLLWALIGVLLSLNITLSLVISFFRKKKPLEEKEEEVITASPFRRKALSLFPFASKENKDTSLVEGETKEGGLGISDKDWPFPPLDLLSPEEERPKEAQDLERMAGIIKKTLADYGIEVEIGEINVGPTFTQFTFKTKTGVKLSQIVSRSDEIAYALARHPIRIEAPIPGKTAVGIEVPNKTPALVRLRSLLESEEFSSSKSYLAFPLGKDVSGGVFVGDIGSMPHLLIAGATGAGKSICLNSILISLLYRNSPRTLKLILVDPKRVEFSFYNDIPHLLAPVINDVEKSIYAFRWATGEMDKRYILLQESGKRNIDEYNRSVDSEKRLPYILIIVDELADLMAQARREVESSIVRLTQMARATGIHMVLATQRPSTDVITGLIKANITHRIAFQVASQIDSRTILDRAGAEKLLGRGDMLYQSADSPKPKRLQGPFVAEEEIKRVASFLRERGKAEYSEELTKASFANIELEKASDSLLIRAIEVVVRHKKASTTLLQNKLGIGYVRAARLIDMLEERGVIGPPQGSKPREVLIDEEQLQEMLDKNLL